MSPRPGSRPEPGRRLIGALVVLLVLATAFNDLYPVLPLGEYNKDGFIYVFPLVFGFVLLRDPAEFAIPNVLTALAVALLVVIVLGVVVNYAAITSAYFKGRTGINRVFTQGLAIALGLLTSLLFYNLAANGYTRAISLGARIGIVVMAVVGFFEFGAWFSLPGLTQVHDALSLVIHEDPVYADRLRATAFEVSWAAVFLSFFYPFALADSRLRTRWVVILTGMVLVMVILTQSRTALLVLGSQVLIFGAMVVRRRMDLLVHALAGATLLGLLVALTPGVRDTISTRFTNVIEYGNFQGNLQGTEENISNVTRLAAIRAAVTMFQQNPVLGVGLGQYGFAYPGELRAEDLRSPEVRAYVDSSHPNWPPTYSMHARLLAETGLIGYLVWMLLVVGLLLRSLLSSDAESPLGRMHLAVAMTLAGWLLLGFSIDSFRFFGGWIAIGVACGLPTRQAAALASRRLRHAQ